VRQAESNTAQAAQRLPGGRHRIPEEEVREHQRTRLIEAISLLSVERGYANVVISEIVTHAGVSKSTFYRFYRTKEECLFDAHKRHSAGLIASVDCSCQAELRSEPERLRAGLRAALSYLSTHADVAHLLTVGILSCGPRGAHRYRAMMDALSARVRRVDALRSADSALAAVLFAASTLTHTTLPEDQIELCALESEFVELFLTIGDRDTAAEGRIGVG
jgi:TetR/AcrR family transcriptional regulator